MTKIIQLQSPFERLKEYNDASPEKTLHKAIILQLIKDATSSSKSKQDQVNKNISREWIFINNPDFVIICQEAGYEPYYIRKLACKFIKLFNGDQEFEDMIEFFKSNKDFGLRNRLERNNKSTKNHDS